MNQGLLFESLVLTAHVIDEARPHMRTVFLIELIYCSNYSGGFARRNFYP